MAHGDDRHPPVLVDVQKNITSKGVTKIVKPTVLTADILHFDQKKLDGFGPFNIATIIQPPSYDILKASMDIVQDRISQGGTMLVYSSHDMNGIMNRVQQPSGYASWPTANPACRVFRKQ